MIRKVVLLILTIVAVGTSVLWLASHRRQIQYTRMGASGPCYWTLRECHAFRGRLTTILESVSESMPFEGWGKHGLPEFLMGYPHGDYASPTLRSRLRMCGFDVQLWQCGDLRFLTKPQPPQTISEIYTLRVTVPAWFVILLAAPYPLITFIRGPLRHRYSRRYRRERGLCERCAYDLTGNVSGVCPECGAKITAADRLA